MGSFNIELEGLDDLSRQIDQAFDRVNKAAAAASLEIAQRIAETAIRSVESQHKTSLPGHAPASQTGELVAAIKARPAGKYGQRAEAVANIYFAMFLEYGTRKMQARPFMKPAAEATFKEGLGIMRDRIAAATKG
jgi:HK97 gp10 family phage protein